MKIPMKKKSIDKLFYLSLFITFAFTTVYAFFIEQNPKRIPFLFGYIMPVVLLFLFWIKLKIENEIIINIHFYLDLIITFLSGIRSINMLMPFLPYSGHVVFILYSWVSTKNKMYRIFAGIVFAITTFFKMYIWHDYFTWLSGMILVMPFIAVSILYEKPIQKMQE